MNKNERWNITPAQHRFIVDNQEHITRAELTALLNKTFDLNLNVKRVASYTKRKGLARTITPIIHSAKQQQWIADNHNSLPRTHLTDKFNAVFGTDVTLHNMRAYCRRHKMKMAALKRNYLPIGYISRHGKFLRIKVSAPDEWMPLHRYAYEKRFGAVPEGFCIMFADGNCDNVSIDNLVCVPASASFVINKNDSHKTDMPELNRASMMTDSLNVLRKRK